VSPVKRLCFFWLLHSTTSDQKAGFVPASLDTCDHTNFNIITHWPNEAPKITKKQRSVNNYLPIYFNSCVYGGDVAETSRLPFSKLEVRMMHSYEPFKSELFGGIKNDSKQPWSVRQPTTQD
jgi:hypothetical protein